MSAQHETARDTRIYVVRHAEPAIAGVLLGQCDPPLSDAGRAQAAAILAGAGLAVIYTSPLRRAFETARMLAGSAPIEIIDDLREITYGGWDGHTWDEIEAMDPDLAQRKLHDWCSVTPPGGEPWEDFAARVKRAFALIEIGPRPAAIIAHAAVNAILGATGQKYGDIHEL